MLHACHGYGGEEVWLPVVGSEVVASLDGCQDSRLGGRVHQGKIPVRLSRGTGADIVIRQAEDVLLARVGPVRLVVAADGYV